MKNKLGEMRTCTKSTGVLIKFCLPVIVLLSAAWSAQAQQVISIQAGYVSRVEGQTWIRRHGFIEMNSLRQGISVADGDVVLTGNDGHAELTLTPGSYLRIGPRSEVLVYAIANRRIHFDILRGEVVTIVEKLEKNTTLVLDTPPAELNIVKRGSYLVRVNMDDATESYVEDGELHFIDAQGQLIILHKHKHVRFAAPARR